MSIATVEIRSFSGPDLVELGSANRPAIVRLNVGPQGATGPAGPAGPNSITSATTSDGTCDLALNTLKVGEDLTTSGLHSVAIGLECEASGDFSVAIGNQTAASAEYSFATGSNTVASGIGSFAGGAATTASGGGAFAIGNQTTASAEYSFAGGFLSTASGNACFAFGVRAKAIHVGASVESDSQDADVVSTAIDEKTFRFANGYRFLGGSASFSGAVTASNLSGTNTGDQDLSGLVAKSAYTPAHSILAQQSGTGSPTAVTLGNNTILGRMSGGGSNIAALSASDARTVMGLGTLATVNGGTGVATALAITANATGGIVTTNGTASLTNKTLESATFTGTTMSRIQAMSMSQSPPMALFEDFNGALGAGIYAWTNSGTGSDAIGGIGPNVFGVRRMTTGGTTGNQRKSILPIPSASIFGTEIRAHFAIPDVTTCDAFIGMEQTAGAFGRYFLLYAAALNSGRWILLSGTGAGVFTNFGTNGPANGNFTSGKRYRTIMRPINATTVYVRIEEADWNGSTWTVMHDANVTITSYTPSADPMALDIRVNTQTSATRSLEIDYISAENQTVTR